MEITATYLAETHSITQPETQTLNRRIAIPLSSPRIRLQTQGDRTALQTSAFASASKFSVPPATTHSLHS